MSRFSIQDHKKILKEEEEEEEKKVWGLDEGLEMNKMRKKKTLTYILK